jgi:hypothetical protein
MPNILCKTIQKRLFNNQQKETRPFSSVLYVFVAFNGWIRFLDSIQH